MNERIKELAIEAEIYAIAEYEKWTPNDDFSGVPHIRNICHEKFAELIVRECAGIFEGVYTDQTWPERIDKRIKRHFGVEE